MLSFTSSQPSSEPEAPDDDVDPRPTKRLRRSRSPSTDEDSDGEVRRPRSITGVVGDEEELELCATQVIQQKYASIGDEPNTPAEHGILERVECYNFMCHDHFSVELGPLINFIVGKNGSGKSAILTAITLCLGGKASATNRGQNLKSFVKEGKENATIVVRIKNQGDGAYMIDDYGSSIIVERHFSKSGKSGFKIKAGNGRIISTKKAELDSIIDHFTLQFDNPMNVLSQDMARQFLSSSSPAEKYKLFVKGVQLEQLDQDYRLIEEFVHQIVEKITTQEQNLDILQKNRDAAMQRLTLSDRHDMLGERIRHVRHRLAWSQVVEQEKVRDTLDDGLAKADEQIATAEAELHGFDTALQEAGTESEAAAEFVRQAAAKLEQAQNDKNEVQAKQDEQTSGRHDLQAQQRQLREYVKAAQSRINETKQKIAEENQRLAGINGGSYARKQEQFEQAKEVARQARQDYEEHQQGTPRIHHEVQEADAEVKSAIVSLQQKKAEARQAETLLQGMERDGGARRSGFHEKMPMLLRAIQQEKSFKKPPVGPIGHHVSLLQPKWSSVLENSLGGTLSSFVVTTKGDMNILLNVMQRVGCVCPILIGSDERIDTSNHEPEPQFDTALRILQIDKELVRRQLIINHGIEQMLLIEKLEEASSVLFDGERPINVKRCYCIDQTDRRRGIHLSYSRTGDPSQAPVQAYTGHPRMKSDLASQISVQREVVEGLKRECNRQEQQIRSARFRLEECKRARERYIKNGKELHLAMQKVEDHAEELGDALDRETAKDGHLEVLQAALEEAEEEKRANESAYSDSVNAVEAIKGKLQETEQEITARSTRVSALEGELQLAQSEAHIATNKRRKILSDKNASIEQIEGMERERERLIQKRAELTARIVEYSEKATLISPRVEVKEGETSESLEQKLNRLNTDLRRFYQQMGASREEIAAEAMKANADCQRAKNQLAELKELPQALNQTLTCRRKRWDLFRSLISTRAKGQFTYLMNERSYRGALITDHAGKLLDLQVEPDSTKDSAGRGAKTLSGGEKSFSQVCLLLALWEAMGSPIRCLDEFDVYMDSANRKMAIDMLMFAARRAHGRQFILITPGSRTDINLAPDIRVKELAEPERGQTALPFGR